MAYVAPTSEVEFFGGVNLSPNYSDSLYFSSETAKDRYFNNIATLAKEENVSYVRDNVFRSGIDISILIKASYMRFRNIKFENKWFYAFITSVNYINNSCTEITWAYDPLLTWMGDFTLGACFVDREHSLTDNIGDNIIEDNIDTGTIINNSVERTDYFGDWVIGVESAVDYNLNQAKGVRVGGLYSGSNMYFLEFSDLRAFIEKLTTGNKADSIIDMYMCPRRFAPTNYDPEDPWGSVIDPVSIGFSTEKDYGSLDGYTPRNNKLHTFPYQYLTVTDNNGHSNDFRYEFFDASAITFTIMSCTVGGVEISCVPLGYKNIPINMSERITMNDFPQVSWNIDSYKAWYAMNKNKAQYMVGVSDMATNAAIAGAALSGVGRVLSGDFGGAVGGAVSDVLEINSAIAANQDRQSMPPITKGNQSTSVLTAFRQVDFYFYKRSITYEYAKIIDDFFTMFGYPCKSVKVPNISSRPHFNYVKTIGCNVHGSIPSEDIASIESIFNNGIRFWKKHTEIGNYSLDNSP